ncbi:MAG: protein meaA [Polyangiaceae bacterium]
MASRDRIQGASETTKRPDRPWIMRTYSGHSTPEASNALYRQNLAKGQTGLSVAFDLPTQTGYDADHPLSEGEVGKVGVPIAHLGDMRTLFDGIPIEKMNTSMTINATAPWLFALYLALAEERGVPAKVLAGTTQNDILKEYLSRGTFIFPPEHSMRVTTDLVTYAVEHVPEWNPINICSYHLQEAGATPEEELAYATTTAIAVLDAVKARVGEGEELSRVFERVSFFVNAGMRFVDETCKMRAFVALWDELGAKRYGVAEAKRRRFRYGVQVNSLGLTAQQPENNVVRIVLEMLGVTLSKNARARAVQLPAWNEALGLPRPWDQQWSLRAQQILAFESDILEHEDIFDGSVVIGRRVADLVARANEEVERVQAMGGAVRAVESGYIKERLVASNAERIRKIEAGDRTVVGVNKYPETEASPLTEGDGGILRVDPKLRAVVVAKLEAHRKSRDAKAVTTALAALAQAARSGENLVPASIAAARAGVTTGEWGKALRDVFGEYRAPTGIGGVATVPRTSEASEALAAIVKDVEVLAEALGRRPKILVGKPGLDGHSNGAEQIALRARDSGFEVVYEGIRVSPADIVASAVQEGVHLVGLSILSGSHLDLVPTIVKGLAGAGLAHVPVVVGGIIPDSDAETLLAGGVARVFTPKDFELGAIMKELLALVRKAHTA